MSDEDYTDKKLTKNASQTTLKTTLPVKINLIALDSYPLINLNSHFIQLILLASKKKKLWNNF